MPRPYKRVGMILGILAATAFLFWELQPAPVIVTVSRVQRGPLSSTLTADGRARIRDVYSVVAPIDGDVERIILKVGDPVSEGGIVARIRPAVARPLDDRSRAEAIAAVTTAQSGIVQAEAAQKEAEAALTHAGSELETARRLVTEGVAPKNNLEHAEHQVEIRRQAVEVAKAAVQTAKAELSRKEVLAASTSNLSSAQPALAVRSPVKGRVLKVTHESGGPVVAGSAVLEIGNTSAMEITADLLTADAMSLQPGAAAVITEWGGAPLKAQVRKIEPAAFTKVSALGLEEQRVRVILDLIDEAPASLGHDFHVTVSVVTWHGENVLTIPSTSLFRSGNQWAVFTVDGGRAHLTFVEPGKSDGMKTAIDRGLAENQDVVSQPSDRLQDHNRVKS
jgi:HlyD family secretion protein